ncbi:MAG: excinuclease ABC subunit UvrC [Alphaproteobacteria bacterium]|nr:excinuclease ABC subunit UvrC [Alphaproteobacteria bacterium]
MGSTLDEQARLLPTRPGCYLFRDGRGRVLYVGKARSLRARVRQYLTGTDERAMVPFLVAAAKSVDVVVTASEKEALLLENSLIKQHRPRFNVKLRDDSNFLHLRVDPRSSWPRYHLVRSIRDDGARYFGPYHSASKARSTLAFLQRAFPLRTCTDAVLRSRTRPCLLHQMDRCVAPCVDAVDRATYDGLVSGSMELLQGRYKPVIQSLEKRMLDAAEALEFERAARLRDLIFSIRSTLEHQNVVDARLGDHDVWALHRDGARGAVAVLPIRAGVVGEPTVTTLEAATDDDGDLLSTLLNTGYLDNACPPEVIVPVLPPDHEALAEVLSERAGRRVALHAPARGRKVRWLELASENARLRYLAENDEEARHRAAMEELAEKLELAGPPERIECFDNSNLGGTHPVAAMSVFLGGRPARGEYRRYRVKRAAGNDDYGMMREILERRFTRARESGLFPDLLVVDGGKGQLGVALAVLHDLGLHDQPVVGIAKPRTERRKGDTVATDKIVLPHRKEPLKLGRGHPALRILQHIRDEAHRTAVRYQRKVRGQADLTSVLEGIPGIGKARRNALLRALGSAEAVADATVEQLEAVEGVGPALARTLYDALHPDDLVL